MEVQLLLFLTAALHASDWSNSDFGSLTSNNSSAVQLGHCYYGNWAIPVPPLYEISSVSVTVLYVMHSFIHSFIYSLVFSLKRPGWQEPEPSHVTGMALAHCILGTFLGLVCHCFPPPLDVPTFAARCLYVRNDARDPSSEMWNCGRERCPVILPKFRLPRTFRDLLHAAHLRHGTDGFTSPPKEGVLRIFSPYKSEGFGLV